MDKFLAHILIVDDDDRIRILVKQYLQDNNYLVTTAKDAFDAKNKIDLINFDLIILDIMMPKKKWTRTYR
jgi:two-component system phosphate regulon response regulator OmpR